MLAIVWSQSAAASSNAWSSVLTWRSAGRTGLMVRASWSGETPVLALTEMTS